MLHCKHALSSHAKGPTARALPGHCALPRRLMRMGLGFGIQSELALDRARLLMLR